MQLGALLGVPSGVSRASSGRLRSGLALAVLGARLLPGLQSGRGRVQRPDCLLPAAVVLPLQLGQAAVELLLPGRPPRLPPLRAAAALEATPVLLFCCWRVAPVRSWPRGSRACTSRPVIITGVHFITVDHLGLLFTFGTAETVLSCEDGGSGPALAATRAGP